MKCCEKVEEQMDYYVQKIGSKEKMEEYFGRTSSQIREQLFQRVKEEMIISEVRLKLAGDLKVTPAQVRRYVKELPEDSLPFIPTQLEVQILCANQWSHRRR